MDSAQPYAETTYAETTKEPCGCWSEEVDGKLRAWGWCEEHQPTIKLTNLLSSSPPRIDLTPGGPK